MDLLNKYLEMMGDTEFAIYVAGSVFGIIFLIGLVAKWVEAKKAPSPAAAPPLKPEGKKEETLVEANPPAVAAAPSLTEGVMTWEFDDGKKKKEKKSSSPPAKTVPPPAPPPPAAPTKEEKPEVPPPPAPLPIPMKDKSPVEDTVSLAASPVPAARPEEKTVILQPARAGGHSPSRPPEPPPAAPPAPSAPSGTGVSEAGGETSEKVWVDLSMYEVLLRRISGMEADLKRDPLYLDPLMKRIGNMEKRLDELAKKGGVVSPATSAPAAESEVKDLKEKVLKMQKVIERWSEGPSSNAPAASSNYP